MSELEPLPGQVQAFYVRHNRAGRRFGPYYSRRWTDEHGQRHREYIRPEDVELVTARCQLWQDQQARQRATARRMKLAAQVLANDMRERWGLREWRTLVDFLKADAEHEHGH